MIVVISFIFLLTVGIAILLLTNRDQESEKAKILIKEILVNIKDLFVNLKDFSVLIIEIVQKLLPKDDEEKKNLESKPEELDVNSSKIEEVPSIEDINKKEGLSLSKEVEQPEQNQSSDVSKDQINLDIDQGSSEVDTSNEIKQQNEEESPFHKESISEINKKDEDLAS